MFRIRPLVRIKWAHVRQGMAFNLPLFAMSPVSDLACCRLPGVLQFTDKCVYAFEVVSAEKPHLVHHRLNRYTMKYKGQFCGVHNPCQFTQRIPDGMNSADGVHGAQAMLGEEVSHGWGLKPSRSSQGYRDQSTGWGVGWSSRRGEPVNLCKLLLSVLVDQPRFCRVAISQSNFFSPSPHCLPWKS